MAESVLRFRVETKDANRKVASLEKQVQRLEIAVKKAGGSTVQAGRGFKVFGSGAQAAAVGARGLGAALSAALGPLVAVAGAAASLGQVFSVLAQQDFAEAKVRSLGVNSEDLTKQLQGVSRELSGQASVLDLTASAYDVASAGFNNAADAAEILKAASLGATGGFSDINTVADATTSVLNAYGKTSADAAALVDGFIQTQNDGKIVIGQYAANIAKVAPVAAALSVPLEEVNAAVAQITAGGQGAEVTFTALKTALAQVAAGKVGKEFEKFGVEISAATLKTDGLAGTLEKIKKSGADAGTVIKAFGTEAGPSILALLNDTEKFNKLLENQKNAQGQAAKAAFEAADTIDGQLKRLTTAFQNLFSDQSELGLVIKESFKVAAVTVEVLAAAVNAAIAPFRGLILGIQDFQKAIFPLEEGVNLAYELEKGYQSFLESIEFGTAVITGFFRNFIGKAKSAALIFKDIIGQIRSGVVNTFTGIADFVSEKLDGIYNSLPKPLKDLIALADNVVGKVTGGISAAFGSFKDAAGASIANLAQRGGFGQGGSLTGKTGALEDITAANNIVPTEGKLKKRGKTDEEKEAERLERLAKASAKRVQALRDQVSLTNTRNEEERRAVQLNIDLRKIMENTLGLTEEQVRAEFDARMAKEDATLAAIAYKNEQDAAAKKAKELADEQAKAAERIAETYKMIGDTIKSGIVDGIKSAIDGTKSLAEVASNVLDNLANQLLNIGVNMGLTALGGAVGGPFAKLFPGRANGGTAMGGRSYLVGEEGPELFTPGRTGSIAPNNAISGGGSIVVNVDATGSTVQGEAGQARQLGNAIGVAIRQELIKQKRPGGLLA